MLTVKNIPFLLKTQNAYQFGSGFRLLKTSSYINDKTVSIETKPGCPVNIKTLNNDANEMHCTPNEWANAKPFRDIPGPKPLPILGNTWRFIPGIGEFGSMTNDLIGFFGMMNKKFGEIVRLEKLLGMPNGVQLYNPAEIEKVYKLEGMVPERDILPSLSYFRQNMRQDLFKNARGLLTSQGNDWYDFRNKVNAIMMQPRVIKQYISPIDNIAKEFVERIKSVRTKDNKISENFWKELNKWALESTAYLALNRRLGCLDGNLPNDSIPARMIQIAEDVFTYGAKLDFEPSPWKYITTPTYLKTMKIYHEQTVMSEGLIKQAMKEINEKKNKIDANVESSEPSVLEKLLKIDEKIAIVMTLDMLLAGVDTTSTALLNILYYLAVNKPKQEILRSEIDQFFSDDNFVLTTSTLNSLPYLKACIKEAARLYPVTPGTMRILTKDAVICGYQVPKGTEVMFPHMYISMNEKQFPNVHEYIPERWLRSNSESELSYKKAHPFCSMPFGFGSRSCIGRRFAELELEVAVMNFVRSFRVSWEGPPPRRAVTTINYLMGPYHFKFEDTNK